MKALKRSIAGLLVLSIVWVGFSVPRICLAASLYAQSNTAPKTVHEPKIKSMPGQDIPQTIPEEGEKKGVSKWVWVGLGALAIGGAALALGGGGGGGDDNGGETTGSFTGTW